MHSMNDPASALAGMLPFDSIGLYEQPKPRFIFKMPRVVPDQKSKFESDELFRRLSRESEVGDFFKIFGKMLSICIIFYLPNRYLYIILNFKNMHRYHLLILGLGNCIYRISCPSDSFEYTYLLIKL